MERLKKKDGKRNEMKKRMMERRKNNFLKKEERQKRMEGRIDRQEKEYGGKKTKGKNILYY